jgi:hypothetical protein
MYGQVPRLASIIFTLHARALQVATSTRFLSEADTFADRLTMSRNILKQIDIGRPERASA